MARKPRRQIPGKILPMVCLRLLFCLPVAVALAAGPAIRIEKPMAPPAWALAERALLKAHADAAREFAQ